MDKLFIAEIKTESPYGYKSDKGWEELFDIAEEIGDVVAVHTNYLWGGSFDLLRYVCKHSSKPVLAKGIHVHEFDYRRCFTLGADLVLSVGLPVFAPEIIFEPLEIGQLRDIPKGQKVMWNSRDLLTGGPKDITFHEVRRRFGGYLIQASYLEYPHQIDEDANGYIVGQHLENFQ
jgi:hypothetical protein